jgi:hypothetical protein
MPTAEKNQDSDCAMTSKDSISNLARKVKSIEHEISDSPSKTTKVIPK